MESPPHIFFHTYSHLRHCERRNLSIFPIYGKYTYALFTPLRSLTCLIPTEKNCSVTIAGHQLLLGLLNNNDSNNKQGANGAPEKITLTLKLQHRVSASTFVGVLKAHLVPLTTAFVQCDPLRPRDLQGPLQSHWWPLSLFHMVIAAADGRLLALTMVALHPLRSSRWKRPSEILLSGV